jgi:hypothetical protein
MFTWNLCGTKWAAESVGFCGLEYTVAHLPDDFIHILPILGLGAAVPGAYAANTSCAACRGASRCLPA